MGYRGGDFQCSVRSMVQDAEKTATVGRPTDSRVTRIADSCGRPGSMKFPNWFNVFRGEMSLVGTSSERPVFCEMYQKKFPSLTCDIPYVPADGMAKCDFDTEPMWRMRKEAGA